MDDKIVSTQPDAPKGTKREMTAGHIVALVIGCLLLLPGLGMLAGGGVAAIGQAVVTDDDGYFEFTLDRIDTAGVAITASDLRFDADGDTGDWMLDWLDVDVRLRVDGARTTDDVFVGIARSDDVDRYLIGRSFSEIIELDGRTPVYSLPLGARSIEPPTEQDFWVEQASGSGLQELTWEARSGNWSVVVMNADGSPVVAADVEVGARSGLVTPIAVTLMVVGGLLAIGAVTLIIVGIRGRRVPDSPVQPDPVVHPPFDPPSPDTAVALDEDRTPELVGGRS